MYYNFLTEKETEQTCIANDAERTICQAKVRAKMPDGKHLTTIINCDPCSSKDIAARHMLHEVKHCSHYKQQPIRMTTVSGFTPWFKEMGVLRIKDSKNKNVSVLCYAQDKDIPGHPNFVILSNNTLVDMEFDANYQMKASRDIGALPLKRLTEKPYTWCGNTFQTAKAQTKPIPSEKEVWEPHISNDFPNSRNYSIMDKHLAKHKESYGNCCSCRPRVVDSVGLDVYMKCAMANSKDASKGSPNFMTTGAPGSVSIEPSWEPNSTQLPSWDPVDAAMPLDILKDLGKYRCYMTEIQLQALLDRTNSTDEKDMDITSIDGKQISKFDIEAIKIGKLVPENLKARFKSFTQKYVGKQSVFPTENGAPRLLTQFRDEPYSLELLEQYTTGDKPKKLPTIRGSYYHGKPATMKIMEHFVRTTPVVERCDDPRCLSRLVIVPKLDPGMPKDSPPTSYRVTMNAIINDCLKPVASTLPLATDEIKKLHGYKYFIKADAMHAYWSIPLDEESKKLLAFQTHEGVFAWNRLTMGCRPSSQVQQTAFHKAMDDHFPSQYRQRLALFADDLAAGADTLEELFEIYQALIKALELAGIQLKASKVEFGRTKCTFHNYTLVGGDGPDAGTTTPKAENLDPIANSSIPQTVTQMKAFLGATQQLAFYVPQYGIAAHPLHRLTKKDVKFPSGEKWIRGSDYDIAYHHIKAIMTDTPLYLFNKVHTKHLFLEVDSSHEGWGAVLYQYEGDAPKGEDPGRHYLLSKKPKRVIQWISKAWTPYDRALPCFYKETIARLLALEAFRNLIETQAPGAGVTCYSDHLPSIKETSLSNKGKLSTWKIHETSDLNSIVQTLWKKGAAMSTADPLSRLARREHKLNNLDLPLLLDVLLKKLPLSIKKAKRLRVNAEKDDAVATRIVQKWREPTNVVSNTRGSAPGDFDFLITAPFADKITHKVADLIRADAPFAALMPISLLNETDRNADGTIDEAVRSKRENMQVIVIASLGVAWLINHPECKIDKNSKHFVLLASQTEYPKTDQAVHACYASWLQTTDKTKVEAHRCPSDIQELIVQSVDALLQDGAQRPTPWFLGATTRSQATNKKAKISKTKVAINKSSAADKTPRIKPRRLPKDKKVCVKHKEHEQFSFARAPKPSPIEEWVGSQVQEIPPKGRSLEPNEIPKGYPKGLIVILDEHNRKRICVPKSQRLILTRYHHEVLLHQKGKRVSHDLEDKYYWPYMEKDIKEICKACAKCTAAQIRRQRLTATFRQAEEDGMPMPRQNYGIDFYGHEQGEILVAIDLCTREVLLWFLKDRKQDHVAKALLTGLIFQKGVPLTFRNDEASEFVKGVVSAMNRYLGIDNVTTGGHNPRGNATVERFMQTLNAALRKCSDKEYKDIGPYLQAIAFSHNSAYNSSINCTPFECGHGLRARSVTDARMAPRLQLTDEGGTDLNQAITQWETSLFKNILRLSERLTDEANKQSQWHKKMTASRLNQSGKKVDDNLLKIGAKVYFYKPPNHAEVKRRGRMTKHLGYYHGPAIVTSKVGERQYTMAYQGKPFTRDVEMIIPQIHLPEKFSEFDPSEDSENKRKPAFHKKDTPLREGELIITRDGVEEDSKDWYLAEVTQVYKDQIQVNYFSTPTQQIESYSSATETERKARLSQAHFRRTWILRDGKNAGHGTEKPPYPNNPALRIWEGPITTQELNEAVLIRDVQLTAGGRLNPESLVLAAKLNIPHNVTLTIEDPEFTKKPSLFTYAKHQLCTCEKCESDLRKREVQSTNEICKCFLCGVSSLAS